MFRRDRSDRLEDRKRDQETVTATPTVAPVYGGGLRVLSIAAIAFVGAGIGLALFYAPLDASQGISQKIFYVHVPLAIVSLCGFIAGGVMGAMHLRSGDRSWDVRSYVAIHLSIVFAVGTLITGSIWAKASWGHWWVWSEPVLVSFLIVFLLYCCYQPLRFSIDDPDRQARYASVFAIAAGAFVPLNFAAVRLAAAHVHPRVLSQTSNLPAPMGVTFVVSLIGVALLWATLWKLELTSKNARFQLRRLARELEPEVGDVEEPASAVSAPVASAPAP